AIGQRALVVHRHLVGGLGRVTAAGRDDLVLQAARGRDHARVLGVLGEELGRGAVIGLPGRSLRLGDELADVLLVGVIELRLAGERIVHALRERARADLVHRHAVVAQLVPHGDAEAVARGARAGRRLRRGGSLLGRGSTRGGGGAGRPLRRGGSLLGRGSTRGGGGVGGLLGERDACRQHGGDGAASERNPARMAERWQLHAMTLYAWEVRGVQALGSLPGNRRGPAVWLIARPAAVLFAPVGQLGRSAGAARPAGGPYAQGLRSSHDMRGEPEPC